MTEKTQDQPDVVLEVRNLVKRYPKAERPVLNGVSLDVRRGEAVVVLGPSGCGKSTLLRRIVGLEDIQGGEVVLDGRGDAFSTDNTEVLAWAKSNSGYVVGIGDLGDTDTIAGAVHKGNDTLLKFVNDLIEGPLAEENFFHNDYDQTLKPVYGDEVEPNTIVAEGDKVD